MSPGGTSADRRILVGEPVDPRLGVQPARPAGRHRDREDDGCDDDREACQQQPPPPGRFATPQLVKDTGDQQCGLQVAAAKQTALVTAAPSDRRRDAAVMNAASAQAVARLSSETIR